MGLISLFRVSQNLNITHIVSALYVSAETDLPFYSIPKPKYYTHSFCIVCVSRDWFTFLQHPKTEILHTQFLHCMCQQRLIYLFTASQNRNITHTVSALYVPAESSLHKITPQKFEFGAVVSFTLCYSHVRCSSCLLTVPIFVAQLWMLLCKWHIRFLFVSSTYHWLLTYICSSPIWSVAHRQHAQFVLLLAHIWEMIGCSNT